MTTTGATDAREGGAGVDEVKLRQIVPGSLDGAEEAGTGIAVIPAVTPRDLLIALEASERREARPAEAAQYAPDYLTLSLQAMADRYSNRGPAYQKFDVTAQLRAALAARPSGAEAGDGGARGGM